LHPTKIYWRSLRCTPKQSGERLRLEDLDNEHHYHLNIIYHMIVHKLILKMRLLGKPVITGWWVSEYVCVRACSLRVFGCVCIYVRQSGRTELLISQEPIVSLPPWPRWQQHTHTYMNIRTYAYMHACAHLYTQSRPLFSLSIVCFFNLPLPPSPSSCLLSIAFRNTNFVCLSPCVYCQCVCLCACLSCAWQEEALSTGAEFIGEGFIFGVVVAVTAWEYQSSAKKSAVREIWGGSGGVLISIYIFIYKCMPMYVYVTEFECKVEQKHRL